MVIVKKYTLVLLISKRSLTQSGMGDPRINYCNRSIAPCKGIQIPESVKFFLVESGILGFGTQNTAQGIRTPNKEWNLEFKLQWKILESSTWNPESLEWDSESKTVLECVPLIWSGSGSVIWDHLDHGGSNEPMNPCTEWIHQFILKDDSKQSDGIRAKKKTCDCLECKVLPSCKVWAQTDKNCKSYWPRLQFQVLCWPGVFNAI